MLRVGITGGIGSGKSTICQLFAQKGVAHYDSDASAKRLMGTVLRARIEERFGAAIFVDGMLDRVALSKIVFSDSAALADLNAIVHPAVIDDFEAWVSRQDGDYVILESALLFSSDLDSHIDLTLAVLAPESLRIERVCSRDRCDSNAVSQRIAAQIDDDTLATKANYTVVNIFEEDLEPAVTKLDRIFRHEATKA